jgi:hypothetical protein
MGKGGGSAPPPPDYAGAAAATAAGNIDAARVAAAANRVNQVTPYGSLKYSTNEGDEDQWGNQMWTVTQTLSPEQKQLLDIQNQTSIGMGNLAGKGLSYVENMIAQPFDTSGIAQTGINPGETMQESVMRRLQPQLEQSREALQVRMANQGIPVGSEAYNRAMMAQGQRENDALTSAVIQGTQTGLAANRQGFEQLGYMRNEPINTLNAVRTGSQVTSPSFVSNIPQQATTQGADLLGATQMGYNAQLGASNAQNAANSNMTSGLMGLAGAGMMAF